MNREDLLVKNINLLSKNILKNGEALKISIVQLIKINPNLGLGVWEKMIRDNETQISRDFRKEDFDCDESIGSVLIWDLEYELFDDEKYYRKALDLFAKNSFLVSVLYSKYPLSSCCHVYTPVSYLIQAGKLQEADNILSSLYKNSCFNDYSELWENIFMFFDSDEITEQIKDFCFAWIERIKDEEEQAGAFSFALKTFDEDN